MEIIAAVATDDGVHTINRHFGDAKQYSIFKISAEDATFLKSINNKTGIEDEVHADPRKAGSVAGLMQNENVNTTVSRAFGPNIKRIKKKFVCVLVNNDKVEEAVKKVQNELIQVESEWKKGPERNYLKLN